MATYRVLADGTIETDSLKEALRVREAILGQRKGRERHGRSSAIAVTEKVADHENFTSVTEAFLRVLVRKPQGLTGAEIAREAGIDTGSIPPIVRGLNTWARKTDHNLAGLLLREMRYEKGRPVSTYKFSELGRKVFLGLISMRETKNGD